MATEVLFQINGGWSYSPRTPPGQGANYRAGAAGQRPIPIAVFELAKPHAAGHNTFRCTQNRCHIT